MVKWMVFPLALVLIVTSVSAGSGHEPREPEGQTECEDQGGKWSVSEPVAPGQCNLPTLDAGKICDDSSDCESACIAQGSMLPGIQTSGVCYGWSMLESDCVNPITSGITQGSTCDD